RPRSQKWRWVPNSQINSTNFKSSLITALAKSELPFPSNINDRSLGESVNIFLNSKNSPPSMRENICSLILLIACTFHHSCCRSNTWPVVPNPSPTSDRVFSQGSHNERRRSHPYS